MRRLNLQIFIAFIVLGLAGSAQAVVKVYDASEANGKPMDQRRISINLCPPIITTLGGLEGFRQLNDEW